MASKNGHINDNGCKNVSIDLGALRGKKCKRKRFSTSPLFALEMNTKNA